MQGIHTDTIESARGSNEPRDTARPRIGTGREGGVDTFLPMRFFLSFWGQNVSVLAV